jgi:8-oxo-dGTP pyrophosphatase MutT (NUDIX family)
MKVRKSARIIVINPAGAVLLVRVNDSTPVNPDEPRLLAYWVPPGGGVDEGESYERAAMRELEEETGIELSEVGPQIWTRERQLMYRGEFKKYVERYFIAWADASRPLRNRTMESRADHQLRG